MSVFSKPSYIILFICFAFIARPSAALDYSEYAKKLLSSNDTIRSQAQHDLQQMSPQVRLPLIQPLMAEIKTQKNLYLRRCGIGALGLIGPDAPIEVQIKTVIPFLIEILLQEKSSGTGREDSYEARYALVRFGKMAVPQLISIFRLHGLDNLASGTLEIHVKNDNKEIVSELIKNLDADDLNIRKGVAGSLRSINSSNRNHVPKLVEVFNSPKNSTLRSDIALIFVNLGSYAIDAAPTIIKGAQDNDEYVRLLCVIALGNLGLDYPSSIPALKKALYDSSCGVRLNAMEGLQKIGTQEAMSAVEQFRASERYCEMGDV